MTVDGGRTQSLTSGRARSLLASLAWRPGQFVPDEMLIERIWSDAMPVDPRDALYTAAKRLRRTLRGVSPGEWVVRCPGGYLLRAEESHVDLYQFRRLVEQAQSIADDGRAVVLYEKALRLWRNTPMADVKGPWAERARESLKEEWRSVRVASIEAELRLGRHSQTVSALTELALSHPYDERVAGLLMLVLYREGRRTEALALYRRFRKELVEAVGNEPSTMLSDLHDDLLRAIPARKIELPASVH
ncbi:AfsR/SARP family transcriptional regulator [Spirillospora sp. NBC_00431]